MRFKVYSDQNGVFSGAVCNTFHFRKGSETPLIYSTINSVKGDAIGFLDIDVRYIEKLFKSNDTETKELMRGLIIKRIEVEFPNEDGLFLVW